MPLVTLDNSGKFVVGTEAINLLRQIKGEIAVVAIAGIYRYVAFTLLNGPVASRGDALLLHIRSTELLHPFSPRHLLHLLICSSLSLPSVVRDPRSLILLPLGVHGSVLELALSLRAVCNRILTFLLGLFVL